MAELLPRILAAYGGLERWQAFRTVEATIVTGGAFWGTKGLVQDPDPRRMVVALHEQWGSLEPYGDPDWHTTYTPDRVAILRGDGSIVSERNDPRASFAGHGMDTPWDPLHRAYFNGYALWLYFTTPFVLAHPGVRVTELEPLQAGAERWSVLRAEFPSTIATHCRVQDFFFGEDLMLRRHDYRVDVAGSFAAAQLISDHLDADGIRFPCRRRAYRARTDGEPDFDALMVSIDTSRVAFSL
ncbi:hypothetical protein [Elioraea rosea]|uniref:hypothetical protein n=1 Tax=Elioraea rosea TaxID=2492390 RepID=UPI001183C969|nr:hypothetical protein [Elioraea rosea]